MSQINISLLENRGISLISNILGGRGAPAPAVATCFPFLLEDVIPVRNVNVAGCAGRMVFGVLSILGFDCNLFLVHVIVLMREKTA